MTNEKTLAGVALLGVVAALLAGCAQAPGSTGGSVPQQSNVNSTDLDAGFEERKVRLSDGRTITCLTWVEYDHYNETKASGLDCDWGVSAE